jgi:hypothetical protein
MIFGTNGIGLWKEGSWWSYKRHWCFLVVAQNNYLVQSHYPGMGWGLVWSLPVLVRGASYYIRVYRTPESGLLQVVGNSVAVPPIGYPSGRHLGFSHRGTGTMLDGGRRPGFARDVYSTGQAPVLRWIYERLWSIIRTPHTCVWRSVVVSRWIYWMVWVKCTTSADCKPIRIAESLVMDGCKDHYIAQCQVLVL